MDTKFMAGEQPQEMSQVGIMPIGEAQVKQFNDVLRRYIAGKTQTDLRIKNAENWWKLRNTEEEQKESRIGSDGGFTSKSSWLHNVVTSKHADALEAYPEPNILPREEGDKAEARMLSAIIPCILEQNQFEETYSDVWWSKCKTGTGVYKVVWDASKHGGLGDIAIEAVNLLNLFWDPGVKDIQESRYVFQTDMEYLDILKEQYPQLRGVTVANTLSHREYELDDHVDKNGKVPVVDMYYHKWVNGKKTLQFCKFVDNVVLYATENTDLAERGLYDHAEYPYVFDALYPIEGSPCGYGYIDISKNPQTMIDMYNTAFLKNAMVGATPRYFKRGEKGVNEEEFMDLSKPIVHVNDGVDDAYLRAIDAPALPAVYVNLLDRTIDEMRETTGNTATSTGSTNSGVTAASAIAALQEASGKGSRDAILGTYRAYTRIVSLCIELIRQFYDIPRKFRITGQYGSEQFVTYQNSGIKPVYQGSVQGIDLGFRKPEFDVKVSAQRKNVYTKVAQNELALQFFQLGFFNPQLTDQALMCLELMDFDGKDSVMQKVAQYGTIQQKLMQYMQLALTLAAKYEPGMVQGLSQDALMMTGANPQAAPVNMPESDNISGIKGEEHGRVKNAREQSLNAAQPAQNK